ncbi:MAG: hypothetical protein HRT38_16000, partial [Alteromonadaceae bacterium]|nr:hypothetical protein [Alteromonadaceae bacterium]
MTDNISHKNENKLSAEQSLPETASSPSVELDILKRNSSDSQFLSEEETKKILTPFAFEIDKSLFGVAIAKPWRRAVAILIDLSDIPHLIKYICFLYDFSVKSIRCV